MRRRRTHYPLWFIVLLLIASAVSSYYKKTAQPTGPAAHTAFPSAADFSADLQVVTRVIDGDTIQLQNGEHVRLIGIDTPESRVNKKAERDSARTGQSLQTITALGQQAKQFVRQTLEGKKVHLEFDVTKRDKYGRLLAYVYLEDGTFVNDEIIRNGYALVMTIPPNIKYAEQFKTSYRSARQEMRGLWTDDVKITAR